MRRSRIGHVQPKSVFRGVQASAATRKTSATRPSWLSAWAIGLAPSSPRQPRRRIAPSGTSAPTTTPGLSHGNGRARRTLEELAQVHAGVEAGHLLGVAVEGQRRPATELADPSLGRLAPAWMVDRRIHVRVEAVLVRCREVPRGRRLRLHETDAHDRLDALEPVLPGHYEAERRAVLVGERLPVEPDREERERMHRLVDAEPFDVGPVEDATLLPGHLLRVEERGEGDVLGARRRLDPTEEIAEGEAEPGDDHRPGLDAAHAVDALLEREPAEQLVQVDDLWFLHLAVDAHSPGPGPQRARQLGRVALVGAELVEVVVGGHVAVRRARLVGAVRPLPRDGKLGRTIRRARRFPAGASAAH